MKHPEQHGVMTLRDLLSFCIEEKSVPKPHARMLVAKAAGLSDPLEVYLQLNKRVTLGQKKEIDRLVTLYKSKKDIDYILQKKEFWSSEFFVNESVLIPRSDSEVIIENIGNKLADLFIERDELSILDLGTGSGCLIISAVKEILSRNKQVKGVAVDISLPSLKVAMKNAENNGVARNIEFIQSDWFSSLSEDARYRNSFDIIISNPPYLTLSEWLKMKSRAEPQIALTDFKDGLSNYRKILKNLHLFGRQNIKYLTLLEFGWMQGETIKELAEGILSRQGRSFNLEIKKDIEERDRVMQIIM